MRRNRRISGFTMAELLIVMAIIAALGGVGFVAVQNYERGLAQLERDSIAQELFVAAQNHLTMAHGQGYMGNASYGNEDPGENGVYYLVRSDANSSDMLDIMLPFGAVDETVRAGGSYIIRYRPDVGAVLDVFYTVPTGRFKHTLTAGEYDGIKALGAAEKRNERRNYDSDHSVVGWYGGNVTVDTGGMINPPMISVENAERLTVTVTDVNDSAAGASLKLIVTGEKSEAQAAFSLSFAASLNHVRVVPGADGKTYTITLDDITAPKMQFSELNYSLETDIGIDRQGFFLPGENVTVRAVAYSNTKLTNIAYSNEITTNSLFADVVDVDNAVTTAMIGNFRHLENLDDNISGVKSDDEKVKITKAQQIVDLSAPAGAGDDAETPKDLSWQGFLKAIGGTSASVNVYGKGDTTGTNVNCFRPVSPSYALEYDGQGHSVTGVVVNYADDAGLFGKVTGGTIANLELIDFDIQGAKAEGAEKAVNAGALAGTLTNVTVTNVLAHGKSEFTVTDGEGNTSTVTRNVTADGSAGGLIGSITGGSVEKSAAALYVKGGGDAGGLIGTIIVTGTTVKQSYSGGHTKDAAYEADKINVTGGKNAGGLIGDAGSTTVEDSYSTCSVSGGEKAGGLVGKANVVKNCYATGLVTGGASAAMGAFAGDLRGAATGNCRFYEIINGDMPALGPGSEEGIVVKALDESIESYNTFVGAPADWKDAVPYDETLASVFKVDDKSRYSLKTVSQLDNTLSLANEFVAAHYGDWPAPETFVENEKVTE